MISLQPGVTGTDRAFAPPEFARSRPFAMVGSFTIYRPIIRLMSANNGLWELVTDSGGRRRRLPARGGQWADDPAEPLEPILVPRLPRERVLLCRALADAAPPFSRLSTSRGRLTPVGEAALLASIAALRARLER